MIVKKKAHLPKGCMKFERNVMLLNKYQRQNNFYHAHKGDESYKYMKNYSDRKSKAKAFVTKYASRDDLLDLREMISQRLDDLKGLDEKMKDVLDQAYANGISLAKKLGKKRTAYATELARDLKPLAINKDHLNRQKAIHVWTENYLAACLESDSLTFAPFVDESNLEKKIKIAYAITSALTGDID